MPDPLSDPLPEVVAEFGESAATASASSPVAPPAPSATAGIPQASASPEPTTRPAAVGILSGEQAALSELRDGLAGMRTDLRQVPEHVGDAISGTVLHAVSVALMEVKRPLESMGAITGQLGQVISQLEGLAGLQEQIEDLKELPEEVKRSASEVSRDLGALTSDIAALVTRVTGIDGRLEQMRGELAESVREVVSRTVRDQLRDMVRDGVRDGLDERLALSVAVAVQAHLADNIIGPEVQEAVSAAISHATDAAQQELERRLVLHMDDAVMQLAEVLMRHQVQALRTVTVLPAEEESAKPAGPAVLNPEHTELDRLLTKITPPASLSEAVANAVARAGIGQHFASALITPPPQVQEIPVAPAPDVERPVVEIPPAPEEKVDDILARWRDPEQRAQALAEAKQEATAAVEAAEQAGGLPGVLRDPPAVPEPDKKRKFFRDRRLD